MKVEITDAELSIMASKGTLLERVLAQELLAIRKNIRMGRKSKLPPPVMPLCAHRQRPYPEGQEWIGTFPCPYPDCHLGTKSNKWYYEPRPVPDPQLVTFDPNAVPENRPIPQMCYERTPFQVTDVEGVVRYTGWAWVEVWNG